MSSAPFCPKCGSAVPADLPEGLCPACLIQVGLASESKGAVDPRFDITIDSPASAATPSARGERNLPAPGDHFGGYHILRTLGTGGMGAVYEADQLDTGRRVAIKVLKHSLDSPESRKRFLREGRLAAAINHPNSVYVFGTEEIEGTPAIAMELIAGGTLQQRIQQQGPLSIGQAVDTVLQIIAGLEAASAAGILHRDIKPANCFIDTEGNVKIGDFGLSISTGPRGDADLTHAGTLLGTPAFSSPEQLRGDELNVRSDIYSVGVTLYYLFTGRTPFEAENLVKLLATVLERPAPSPRSFRPDIPRPLAATVLRCLEKQPGRRYGGYGELRQALLPFASAAPTPATLGLRVLAGAIDGAIIWSFLVLVTFWQLLEWSLTNDQSPLTGGMRWWQMVPHWAVWTAYFVVPEGLWGVTPGKALCGLRVVGLDRAAPGVLRAAARFAILALATQTPGRLLVVAAGSHPDWLPFVGYAGIALNGLALATLFALARRSNGYAGLHDWLTRTRVVARQALPARAGLPSLDDLPAVSGDTPQIGPYHVLQMLAQREGEEWLLGYDQRLLRRVWIRRLPANTPPVDAPLRNLGRIGRLRWLSGRRSAAENWDAYEAVSGQALNALLDRPRPWREVRFWLLDLAEELTLAEREGTVPATLALDCVWITAEARAKLLDFPAPDGALLGDSGECPFAKSQAIHASQFLRQMAIAALAGRIVTAREAESRVPAVPLPLKARDFLSLPKSLASTQAAAQTLRELVSEPAETSRGRRFAVVLASMLPCAALVMFSLVGLFVAKQALQRDPERGELIMHLVRLKIFQNRLAHAKGGAPSAVGTPEEIAEEVLYVERYVARRFGKSIGDPTFLAGLSPDLRGVAVQALAKHPQVTEAEFKEAEEVVRLMEEDSFRFSPFMDSTFVSTITVTLVVMWLYCVAFLSLAAALLCRGGLLLWLLGLAVVRNDGNPASRGRVFWRALLVSSPLLLFPLLATAIEHFYPGDRFDAAMNAGFVMMALLYLGLVTCSVLLPGRGIADRLAGTWLVPR